MSNQLLLILIEFTLAGDLSITPTQWLQFTLRGGVDSYTETREYFFPIHSAGSRAPGQYAEDVIKENEVNFDVIGKAEFELSSDINLQATLVGITMTEKEHNSCCNYRIPGQRKKKYSGPEFCSRILYL